MKAEVGQVWEYVWGDIPPSRFIITGFRDDKKVDILVIDGTADGWWVEGEERWIHLSELGKEAILSEVETIKRILALYE